MTGFGVGSVALGAGRIAVEIRAVNGRFLDVRVRVPHELGELAITAESEARKRLARGRCDISVRVEGNVFPLPLMDKERARQAFRSLVELRDELTPGADVPFSMLASVPNLFVSPEARDSEPARNAVRAAVMVALDDLDVMRRQEGEAISHDLSHRLSLVRALLDRIGERGPDALATLGRRFRERLARVRAVLDETGLAEEAEPGHSLDPARIEQELVLLVERSDTSEELVRLRSHLDQLLAYIGDETAGGPKAAPSNIPAGGPKAAPSHVPAGGPKATPSHVPIGRRLDFLLQEMAREINTIGAKSQDLSIAHAVVELKAEIERMREQVQNVE
ncbi:MAG TPA: DUF1732 domain-containing protein [Polyangiaceae bacterium]